jgi:hypothetical protein
MNIPATNKPTLNTTVATTLAHLYQVIQGIKGTNRNKTKNYLQSKVIQPPLMTYVTCTMAIQVNQEAVNNQPITEIIG